MSAVLAFKFKEFCVAVDTGFDRSEVLSTLPKPTSVLLITTTPVLPLTLLAGIVGMVGLLSKSL